MISAIICLILMGTGLMPWNSPYYITVYLPIQAIEEVIEITYLIKKELK